MRCSKCKNIWHESIVPSQIQNSTDKNCKSFIIFLFSFLSPLSLLYSFFFLSSLILPQTFLSTHLFFHSFFFSLLLLFSLLFSLTAPPNANLCCCGFFFFFFFFAVIRWVGWQWMGQRRQWVGVWDANGLCFLLLCLFFCSGGFGVLLCYFWCETMVGGMWVGRWWVGCGWGVDGCWQRGCGLWVVVGVVGFFILYFYILLVFLMLF